MSNRSDFNARLQPASVLASDFLYADLPMAFNVHPLHNDIKPLVDIDAVKQSVKNLVLTNYFDIPFHPEIGSNVSSLLFELVDQFTAEAIKREIRQVLYKYERRVQVLDVDVIDQADQNAYQVSIKFLVVANDKEIDIEFYLNRQR